MFKVQYCRQKVISGIDDFGSDIAQISMAIQNQGMMAAMINLMNG